jgi:exodeoxyribonuclease V alpha subunit
MDLLEGLVERITYYNVENGYIDLRLNAHGCPGLITVVGSLPKITSGESLRLQGQWITNLQYGKQFNAEKCEQVLPPPRSDSHRLDLLPQDTPRSSATGYENPVTS